MRARVLGLATAFLVGCLGWLLVTALEIPLGGAILAAIGLGAFSELLTPRAAPWLRLAGLLLGIVSASAIAEPAALSGPDAMGYLVAGALCLFAAAIGFLSPEAERRAAESEPRTPEVKPGSA